MTTKTTKTVRRIIQIVILGIMCVGIGLFIYGSKHTTASLPAPKKQATVAAQLAPYTSTQDKFVVSFPQSPVITHHTTADGGSTVQQNNYESNLPHSSTDFYITATTYPDAYITDTATALTAAANGEVKNMQGAKTVSNTTLTYQGDQALDTVYSVPEGKTTYLVSSRNLLHGNTIYTILVFHGTADNFTKFANSFRILAQ